MHKNTIQLVECYKFWDIVTLYARERLEHDSIIARALARGVVVDGLRLQSVDARWLDAARSLTGYPLVGYSAKGDAPVLLRAEALEHLLSVVRTAAEPQRDALDQEFVQRDDFGRWLKGIGQPLPAFWFDP
jgi:hypothetical protein